VELERIELSPEAGPESVRRTKPAPQASAPSAFWPFLLAHFKHQYFLISQQACYYKKNLILWLGRFITTYPPVAAMKSWTG
jgi:hypothetical protein